MKNTSKEKKRGFVFFGTPKFAVYTLEEMKRGGLRAHRMLTEVGLR